MDTSITSAAPTTPVADASLILCPDQKCSEPNSTSAKFCKKCGKELTPLVSHVTPIVVESEPEDTSAGTPRPVRKSASSDSTFKEKPVKTTETVVETKTEKESAATKQQPTGQNVVNNNNRRPWWELLLVAILIIALVVLAVIALRGCNPVPATDTGLLPLAATSQSSVSGSAIVTPTLAVPTLVPTTVASTAPTTSTVSSDNNIVVNDVILGVVDPQQQQNHAAGLYMPTGVSGHNVWTIAVPKNAVLIVGGTDVNGVSGGVYQAWSGGQTVTIDVTNGFALVTLDRWANWEFCFRVGQAIQYGWDHNTVVGLPNWTCQ
ncbi:MAG: zinc ribbon domain-containing protein [Candidatus Shapirobacteria bacterium]